MSGAIRGLLATWGELSPAGVARPLLDCAALVMSADRLVSRVENIRVKRLVMDGFSGMSLAGAGIVSDGGVAATVLLLVMCRFSMLAVALPAKPVAGLESGDPVTDDVKDGAGDGSPNCW